MSDNPVSKDNDKNSQLVDLSSLQDLNFKTAWDNQPVSAGQGKPEQRRGAGGGRKFKDRRPPKGNDSSGNDRRDNKKFSRGGDRKRRNQDFDNFKPTVKVYVTPEELPFRKLIKVMRSSCRTYELFDIAKIILEKPERYILNIEPLEGNKDSEFKPFYISIPHNIPFNTEEEAVAFSVKNNLEEFFTIEEIEQEAPSGNFTMVNRCGITSELLSPPNYHRYNEILQEHCSVQGLSLDRVSKSIESVSEQDVIQEWIEKMKKQKVYTLKDKKEDEPENFSSLESAKNFLARTRGAKLFKRGSRAKISGVYFDKLPEGDLKKSIKFYLDSQTRFPLDTATGLRVRLRKMNFSIFKKSAKNISFVCAVKRKQKLPDAGFAPSIQSLLDFIKEKPEIKNSDLSEEYCGIKLPASKEEEVTQLSEEEQSKLKQLKMDLFWLVSEGYVTEYANGELVAVNIQNQKKVEQPKITEAKVESVPVETSSDVVSSQATEEKSEDSNTGSEEKEAVAEDAVVEEVEAEKPTTPSTDNVS